jgi:hypothetical protein
MEKLSRKDAVKKLLLAKALIVDMLSSLLGQIFANVVWVEWQEDKFTIFFRSRKSTEVPEQTT